MSLRIGTSGWSYPSGKGTWNGLFYPPRKGRGSSVPGFDELTWYAEHFDTVEVNSSFYGTPTPQTTRKWAERTPAGFEFCLKLHQQFTHTEMYERGGGAGGRRGVGASGRGGVGASGREGVGAFTDALEPLAVSNRLGALLAQFPPSFHDTPANREYLDWLLATFAAYPVAVELRHKTWSDRHGETLALLDRHRAAWTQIDEPKFRWSIRQNGLPNQEGIAYMRLHGRNAAQWWHHDAAEDRYNYLYSGDELAPVAEAAVATSAIVKKAYLFLNNHFASKAVVNAVVLKHLTGEPISGSYPPEMVERYPELARLVEVAPFTASRTFF